MPPFRSEQSYPQPDDLELTDHSEYPLRIKDKNKTAFIGLAARHEFLHMISDHPKTDVLNFEGIKRAAEAFLKGDDSYYYFVFRKKGQNGELDQVLITENNGLTPNLA